MKYLMSLVIVVGMLVGSADAGIFFRRGGCSSCGSNARPARARAAACQCGCAKANCQCTNGDCQKQGCCRK